MSDLAFFRTLTPLTLAAIAAESGAQLPSDVDPSRLIRAVAPLERAGPNDLSAFHDEVPAEDLLATSAGACFVASRHLKNVPAGTIALIIDRPREAFRRVASTLLPDSVRPASATANRGIDPSAHIHPDAQLEPGVTVEPGAVIGPGVEIGSGTFVGACAVIGARVRVGRNCAIDAHASLAYALIGDRVVIGAGARIGQGAWARPSRDATPNLGRVIIQNNVEIGVNAAIERGELADTVIGEGCRVASLGYVEGGSVLVPEAWQV